MFIHSAPTDMQLSSSSALRHPAVPPLELMNDLAGDGSCGCGGASGAHKGEETHFLLPPSHFSHSPGYTPPGTGWSRLIGLSVRMTSWSSVGFSHRLKTNIAHMQNGDVLCPTIIRDGVFSKANLLKDKQSDILLVGLIAEDFTSAEENKL